MRIVCIDFGEKRTGIAISSGDNKLAFPKYQIETKDLFGCLQKLADEYGELKIVFGKSINLKGEDNEIMTMLREYKTKLDTLGFKTTYHDERFSTIEASRLGKGTDKEAATIILQSYLDTL